MKRVAVIGTGSIGMRHLDVLRGLEGVEPVAVPKRTERLSQLADAGYEIAATLDEAVDKGVSLGIVATDTAQHVEDGLSAIAHGLDIMVEKPLSVNSAQAEALNRRGTIEGRKIFVGCVLRFSQSLGVFRELLPKVGQVHNVRIECQSYLPGWRAYRNYLESYSARPQEGGVLLDLIHEVDYAGWIFGWPRSVQARLRNTGRLGIETEEIADINWELAGGGVLSINLDYLSQPSRRRMRASGENGTIEWDGIESTTTLSLNGLPDSVVQSPQNRDEMYEDEDRAFLLTEPGKVEPRLATADEGLKALSVCDAARTSSDASQEAGVVYP